MEKLDKQVKRFYRISKRNRLFERRFYELISKFIARNTQHDKVNWTKFDYEFKTIGRKCKQKGRSAKCYVIAITYLVAVCLKGYHKKLSSQKIVREIQS